jgi:light-regulated signal transduction histidine kinase (bacteriophytochrome)
MRDRRTIAGLALLSGMAAWPALGDSKVDAPRKIGVPIELTAIRREAIPLNQDHVLIAPAPGSQPERVPVVLEQSIYRGTVLRVGEALRQDFELSGMTLRTEVECDVTMRADRERLARAFCNIAGNARDAMGEQGTFSILATSLDHRVRFVLADTGPGMRDELRDRVSEPFVSGKQHGTGLGLAIARQIVPAHGGEIRAESEPGQD